MMVKICGITNRDDAMAAVDAGASAIGFNFYHESPRYISPTGAALIAGKIPTNVWKVGVFVDETAETVAKIALRVGLDVAQLHGISEARGIRIWHAAKAGDPDGLALFAADETIEAFLLDTPSDRLHGGTGTTFDWSIAKGLPHKIIVAGGLDGENVAQAIAEAQPWGVDACSRLEKSPGLKDHFKMRKFIIAALEPQ
ncbi:MAG: phosphoribosylanthranilate isomerase [Bryobacteraceae bacterium]|jgi:phosphoribosylanthranilate isomerase